MIKRIPALYNRQEMITGLHPPEKVLIYLTSGAATEAKGQGSRTSTFLWELIEGLALIGCTDIFLVCDQLVREALAGRIGDNWVIRARAVLKHCRPYINFAIVDRAWTIQNIGEIDADDMIYVHTAQASDEDLEFASLTEDVYIANTGTFEVMRMRRPAKSLDLREQVPDHGVEQMASSAQALLLINMVAKPEIYRKTGTTISAMKFLDLAVTTAAREIGICGFQRRQTAQGDRAPVMREPVHPRPQEVDGQIRSMCIAEGVRTFTDLSKKYGVNPATARTRIKLGWTLRRTLGLPEEDDNAA